MPLSSPARPKTFQWEPIMKPNDISLLMLFMQPAEPPRLAGTESNYKKKGFHAATEFTTSFETTCRTKFGQKNHHDFLAKFPFTGKSPTKTGHRKKTQPMHESQKNNEKMPTRTAVPERSNGCSKSLKTFNLTTPLQSTNRTTKNTRKGGEPVSESARE